MPSCLAAFVMSGSIIPLHCIGPGERCCDRGGVLVGFVDGCLDPDAPKMLTCHGKGQESEIVFGTIVHCQPGNQGNLCFLGSDDRVYDLTGRASCARHSKSFSPWG